MIGPATRCGKYETNNAIRRKESFGYDIATIGVDAVAHRDECIKADAHRQGDIQRRRPPIEAQHVPQADHVVSEEIEILEEAQDDQVRDHAGGEKRVASAILGESEIEAVADWPDHGKGRDDGDRGRCLRPARLQEFGHS